MSLREHPSDRALPAGSGPELRRLVQETRTEERARPWTTREVADHYRVQPATVLAWVEAGKLPVLRRRPGKRGGYLFAEADVVALDAHGRDVSPSDVAAVIDAEMRKGKRRRGA